ncbi:MAG: ABC transporter substrate-binding protein [Bariatricus sp.]
MKRKIYGLVVGMMSVLVMAGCGQQAASQNPQGTEKPETVQSGAQATESGVKNNKESADVQPADEITFWSTKEDCFSELCEEFAKETGIKVNATYMGGYDDMVNKVMAGIAGKKLPDVAQLGQRHGLAQMYDSGYLLPVEEYVDQDIMEDILPGFWKRFTYKDKKVILPFQNSMPMLYYNKDMLAEAGVKVPESMDELVAVAKELKDKTGNYGFTFNSDYPWYIMALMYNSGTAPVVDGKPCMNSELVRKIFEQVSQMSNTDQSMPKNQHATAQEDFCNGKVAMLMTSCASYAKVEKLVDGKFEIGLAMFPEVTTMDITMGGNGLGLFKTTPEKQKAATMFVEFMLDNERVAKNCLNSGYIPVTNGATNTETYKKYLEDPNRQVVNEQLQYLGGAAVNPADSLVWSEVMSLVDSVEADPDVELDARLAEIDSKIGNYLNEYAGK